MKKVGIVEISYNKDGAFSGAKFSPSINEQVSAQTKEKIGSFGKAPEDVNEIYKQADVVMSDWFNKVNEIELADRGEYELKREVLYCLKWKRTGLVRRCKLSYHLEKAKH